MVPKTKIIATLGPSSSTASELRKMFQQGLDAVRLNFSHSNHASHIEKIGFIRSLNKKLRRHIRIMQDLEGYRIRVGKLHRPLALKRRSVLFLTQGALTGNEKEISFDYQGPLSVIPEGSRIFIDDGKIALEVTGRTPHKLKTRVISGGILMSHKGINLPGVKLAFAALTDKDKRDVRVGIEYKVDYLAQSFVRSAADILLLKQQVLDEHPHCQFFAKIENQDALVNLDSIIDASDGIIVARGDLGICLPIYKVPLIQKDIISRCLRKKKPVVVATQMLESMTNEPLPTRAEVSDVANAILDGATHLMLSAETAVGKHPHQVIEMMNKIIKHTELYGT